MNMKQLSAMIVLFVAVGTAMAVIISPFTGWDDLTRKSPDIVIARCATTPNPTGIGDGMISSDVLRYHHQRFAQTAKDFLSHCQRWRQRDSGHHSKATKCIVTVNGEHYAQEFFGARVHGCLHARS